MARSFHKPVCIHWSLALQASSEMLGATGELDVCYDKLFHG